MSQDQGVPETTVASTTTAKTPPGKDGQAAPEPRAFKSPPEAPAQPTNIEAVAGAAAPSVPTHAEMGDFWREAFAPLLAAQVETGRWLDRFWRQAGAATPLSTGFTGRLIPPGLGTAFGLPAADLRETDKEYLFSVELPGMAREDIDLKVENDTLRICGHKTEEKAETRADFKISERRYGRFERTFPLPQDAKRDAIKATYADGVLKIVAPKAEAARTDATRIPIG